MELIQSVAFDYPVLMVRSSDHVTGADGATLDIALSKKGGAFTSISPVVVPLGHGRYTLKLTSAMTDTVGAFSLHIEADACDPFDSSDQVISAATLLIPSGTPISVLATLKKLLGIAEDDTSQDVELTDLIRFAVTVVQNDTHRYFGEPHAVTEYHDGNGCEKIYLDGHIDDSAAGDSFNPDPSSSLVIARRPRRDRRADWETLEENVDWERREDAILFLGVLGWGWPECDEFRFQYLDGYADAPADIKRVIVEIALRQWGNDNATASGIAGVVSETLGDFSYQLDSKVAESGVTVLSDFALRVLNFYRRKFA